MKRLFAFAMVAMFAIAPAAHAVDVHLELGAGVNYYTIQGNGIWYQKGNPMKLERTKPAFMVGVTGDAYASDHWGVAYHADYINFGHANSHCYCTPRDDYYDAAAHRQLPGSPVPNANYVGTGSAQGIKVSLAPYLRYGAWKVGAEVGVIEYRATWREDAYGWSYFPGPTSTNHLVMRRNYYNSALVGIFAQRGSWTASMTYYNLRNDQQGYDKPGDPWVPALYKGAIVTMVTYTF